MSTIAPDIKKTLDRGLVIPAHPLALNASRKLDERRQRALTRYYFDAGAGGVAVGGGVAGSSDGTTGAGGGGSCARAVAAEATTATTMASARDNPTGEYLNSRAGCAIEARRARR